jgi:hypothetical protein
MTKLLRKIVPVKLHRLLRLAGPINATGIPRVTTAPVSQNGIVSQTLRPMMIGPRYLDDNHKRGLTKTGLHPSPFEIS